ncbi:IS3 family transposase, partial [Patescibacteria group bacterium]|nr:IS3 family transposase [Patescibacteria group bacterium]
KLYEYVDWYNHERRHGSINATPVERLAEYAKRMENGDNAV